MKKGIKVILIILGIWLSIFLVDFICVKTIKRPIFMIRTVIYKDGGTKEYLGLGYKVVKCNTLIDDNKVTIGTWALDYNCDTKVNNNNENTTELDSVKFSKEYGTIDASNPFVYRNINEILNILENGTGIIYLGFPECPWCKAYIPYLNSVAKDNNLEKIYYFNILEDRKNNTEEYKKIVSLTSEHLRYDEEGNLLGVGELSEKEKMLLRGRIDRVDVNETEDKVYVKVIDYKSNNKEFDLVSVYYGLSLQLVVYMNAAMELTAKEHPDKKVVPAAMLYYHVEDPTVESPVELTEEEIQEQILEKLRMNGVVNSEPDIVECLDTTMQDKSRVIPVEHKKDGSFSARSSVMSPEELQVVSNYVNHKMEQYWENQ